MASLPNENNLDEDLVNIFDGPFWITDKDELAKLAVEKI